MNPYYEHKDVTLYQGDCTAILPLLPSGSVDAVITDPPYPEISRDYGRMSEGDWFEMMRVVVPECMRLLKPTGSAVFILQPNSEKVGRMRTWLWEFMVWVGKEWGIVQDAYWWNITAAPTVHTHRTIGLMRPSLKACVWVGPADCYRNQELVLWSESEANATQRVAGRVENELKYRPSGSHIRDSTIINTVIERGGVTPYNVLPLANANSVSSAGAHDHGAGTPFALASWWTRYLCPPGGVVLDPFTGSGTMGLAALEYECEFVGIEQMDKHAATARARLEAEQAKPRQLRLREAI